MLTVYSDKQELHNPDTIVVRGRAVPNYEIPSRTRVLRDAMLRAGHEVVAPRDFGRSPIAAIHDPEYLVFLETAYERWQALPDAPALLHSHAFPHYSARTKPAGILGQVGYYLSGGVCPLDGGTWAAAVSSAHCALHAAEAIRDGAHEAYAICRPPGHHAYRDCAGGFCYLNNMAIAAHHLTRSIGRVAILDIDVHHGNGTQSIFYERDDVHFVSIHADPNYCAPFYAGYSHECGAYKGIGHNLNLPLPAGSDSAAWINAIRQGLASIRNYGPDAVLVSLGFDAFEDDPTADLVVNQDGFRAAGACIGGLGQPIALIQEGGYVADRLGDMAMAFFEGFLEARPSQYR